MDKITKLKEETVILKTALTQLYNQLKCKTKELLFIELKEKMQKDNDAYKKTKV